MAGPTTAMAEPPQFEQLKRHRPNSSQAENHKKPGIGFASSTNYYALSLSFLDSMKIG